MTYMQGATVKGLKLVTKITELLNQLTLEDFDETYIGVRVSITDEFETHKELGRWYCEYGYGNWCYFDGDPKEREIGRKTVKWEEIRDRIAAETPPHDKAHDSDINKMAQSVVSLLKEKGIL